jgi:hypothetical protein
MLRIRHEAVLLPEQRLDILWKLVEVIFDHPGEVVQHLVGIPQILCRPVLAVLDLHLALHEVHNFGCRARGEASGFEGSIEQTGALLLVSNLGSVLSATLAMEQEAASACEGSIKQTCVLLLVSQFCSISSATLSAVQEERRQPLKVRLSRLAVASCFRLRLCFIRHFGCRARRMVSSGKQPGAIQSKGSKIGQKTSEENISVPPFEQDSPFRLRCKRRSVSLKEIFLFQRLLLIAQLRCTARIRVSLSHS